MKCDCCGLEIKLGERYVKMGFVVHEACLKALYEESLEREEEFAWIG